jgi:hypothetical protein
MEKKKHFEEYKNEMKISIQLLDSQNNANKIQKQKEISDLKKILETEKNNNNDQKKEFIKKIEHQINNIIDEKPIDIDFDYNNEKVKERNILLEKVNKIEKNIQNEFQINERDIEKIDKEIIEINNYKNELKIKNKNLKDSMMKKIQTNLELSVNNNELNNQLIVKIENNEIEKLEYQKSIEEESSIKNKENEIQIQIQNLQIEKKMLEEEIKEKSVKIDLILETESLKKNEFEKKLNIVENEISIIESNYLLEFEYLEKKFLKEETDRLLQNEKKIDELMENP